MFELDNYVFGAVFVTVLGFTVLVELVVAVLFGLRSRGLAATIGVNFVTNPIFNLALLVTAFVAGLGAEEGSGRYDWVVATAAIVLEVVVVYAEWRLLVWVLRGTALSSRRLLAFSIVANAASALLFLAVYRYG